MKQKRIHTTIDLSDLGYCEKNDLKFAHLLRSAIRDHRLHSGDKNIPPSAREIQIALDKAIEHRDKIISAVNRVLSEEQAIKVFQNI